MRKFVVVLTVWLILLTPTKAGTLYFSSVFDPTFADGGIHRISTDGDWQHSVLTIGGGLRDVRLDPIANKLYWTDVNADVIRRANLDGSNIQDVVTTGLSFPVALALNPSSNTLYWGDQLSGEIGSATLDGGSAGQLLATPNFSGGIVVDDINGKIYWSEFNIPNSETGRIMRANLNGTSAETIITDFGRPDDLAIDIIGGKIYWTDHVTNVIGRVNLDGTNPENIFVVGANNNPGGIALDPANGKVYWGQDGSIPNRADIMRMNLDGSSPEVIATGFGSVGSMSFSDSSAPILLKPIGVLNGQPPVFEWSNVGSEAWYRLWVTDDSGVVIKKWYKATDICDAETCSVSPQIHTMGISTWQVRGYDGALGEWSDRGRFWDELTRPSAASLVLPLVAISDPTPEFEWEVVADATWYKLEVLGSSDELMIDQWFRADSLNIDCLDGITCKVDSMITFDSNFRWRVRTYNPSGLGPWTDYEFVTFIR